MKNVTKSRLGGFTLIELLVVVLIIGILAAIAVPQYQRAVDKSRYATLMPVASTVKNAQETFYMASAMYSNDLQDLDISLPGTVDGNKAEFGDGVKVEVSADANSDYVSASKDGLENKYVMYFAKSENFPKEVHCEALSSSDRAKQLCVSMGGTEIGANGKYTVYVLEGSGSGTLNGGSSSGGNAGESGNTGGLSESKVGTVTSVCEACSNLTDGDEVITTKENGDRIRWDFNQDGTLNSALYRGNGNFFYIVPDTENGGYVMRTTGAGSWDYSATVDKAGNIVSSACTYGSCPSDPFPFSSFPTDLTDSNRCSLFPGTTGC